MRHTGLSAWEAAVSSAFPHLSRSFARGLAWWSFGIAHTRSSGRRTIATWFALVLGQQVNTIEQRLYAWCIDAAHKAGTHRQTLDVTTCFAPLLAWVLRLWTGTQLALTLDATPLRDRFTCLTVSVVYRGNAIPVAWTILPASQKRAWNPLWVRLLALIQPAIPTDWTVLVLTDRGLWSATIYRAIQAHGWHPFMRITRHSTVRPADHARAVPPTTLTAHSSRSGEGWCRPFSTALAWPPRWWCGWMGSSRAVVYPDRSTANRQRCGVVWATGMVRTGLQMHQTRHVAVAANAHE